MQQSIETAHPNHVSSLRPMENSYVNPPQNLKITRSEPNYIHQGAQHAFSKSPQYVPSKGTSTFDQFDMQEGYRFPNQVANPTVAQPTYAAAARQAAHEPYPQVLDNQFQQQYPQP